MSSNEIAISANNELPSRAEWETIFGMATQLVPTGFLPRAVDTPQKAAAIMLKGRELGVPAMYALSNISVINGKPVAGAELMLGLVKRAYGRDAIWVEDSTAEFCKVGYLVHGKPKFYTFTMDMAKKAGLLSSQTWTKYPDAMLRARCISAVCRFEFPEIIGGMYVTGELGESVTVDESTGEVYATVTIEPANEQSKPISIERGAVLEPEPTPQELWNKASARLHAIADDYGITHADISNHAKEIKKSPDASTRDLNAAVLNGLADKIEANPEAAIAFYADLRERVAAEQESEPATATADEFADVNAALNAQLDAASK